MVQGVGAAKEAKGYERAVALLREAVAIDANLWEAHFDLGVVLAGGGELKQAEASLERAAALAPAQEDVAVALAEVRRRRGSNKDAAEGLASFVKAHPEGDRARTLLVTCLRDSGQVDKAIVEAREVLAKRSGNATALSELALCHLAKGERDIAELLAKQATDVDPKNAAAHRTVGMVLLARGDDALAFQSFQKAAAEDPKDTTARLNMGVVLLRAGAYAKAGEQYRAILAVSRDDSLAELGLAAALRGESEGKNKAKLEEAERLLQKILGREPHNYAAAFNLGVLYQEFLKRPADAKPYFDRYLSDAPDNDASRPEATRYLSMASGAAQAAKNAKAAPPPPPTPPVPPPTAPQTTPPPAAAPTGTPPAAAPTPPPSSGGPSPLAPEEPTPPAKGSK
jgi:tetratricopeptide (TPR) repeat protein